MNFLPIARYLRFFSAVLSMNIITALAADVVVANKPQRKANASIIFDAAGNAVFTSNNTIIGSAVNFKPAKNLRPMSPVQVIVDGEPDGPMGPPDPKDPPPPKIPDYTESPPKPKPPKPSCESGPGCPIPLGRDARLIKYAPDVREINVYKLEKGVLSKQVMQAAGR